ncbi:MAG: hypothetical protein CMD38_00300 [Flavobacteriales bacterium]|nr:hypothetical protein [Flavobacteriales bacterium]|tara:strand:- start:1407 stop:2705 length:1299 start_codon:yes stop_codon:yes gene_type:complete
MAAYEFDVLNSRPHFPGYPIFCFLSQIILILTDNIALTFSLIGSISTFIIIYYCDKIWQFYFQKQSLFFITILFFNPFMWLMSNRYMPDLFALSLLVTGTYYLIKILKKTSKKDNIILGIIISLLCGVRISYIPFFIPIIFLISSNTRFLIFSFLITNVIWLTPFIHITGIYELIELFKNDSYGHFYKWGGTIISSDGSLINRFLQIFNFIFTDIFSFWSHNRHWSTIINSFLIIIAIIFFFKFSHTKFKKVNLKLISCCFLIYFIWVMMFQNIQYKPRHLLPFIPLCCFIISMGINSIQKKTRYALLFSVNLLTIHAFITINIVYQHKHMSAISQIHNYLQQQKNNTIVISDNLKLFYWKSHSNNKNIKYYNIDRFNQLLKEDKISDGTIVYSTSLINPNNYRKINSYDFYHNPYVNRLWSSLTLNKYEKY